MPMRVLATFHSKLPVSEKGCNNYRLTSEKGNTLGAIKRSESATGYLIYYQSFIAFKSHWHVPTLVIDSRMYLWCH